MAKNLHLAEVVANAKADLRGTFFNDGYLRIYTGAQPANADAPVTTQELLAELRFAATAFPDAVAGVAVAALISDPSAQADGEAAWFRVLESDGVSVIEDGSVGTANANLVLDTLTIRAGRPVSVSAYTIREPLSEE